MDQNVNFSCLLDGEHRFESYDPPEKEIICKNHLAPDHNVLSGSHWYKNLYKFGVK